MRLRKTRGCLDLVIGVDTSVAHLAAALGKPTWLLLPNMPDFRWLLGRDEAAVAAKRERLAQRGPLRGIVGTVSEAVDLIGQYRDAGVHLLINSDYRNDIETHELFASDIMSHFA